MKLSEYLILNNLSLGQLAKRCGTSASTILRMKEAEVAPSKRVAEALWRATDGQVTPNDLFGLHYAEGHCICCSPLQADGTKIGPRDELERNLI
jgi:transcriptional regulator with XRE-family HTH domain